MPIHDWTKVKPGYFHVFHQRWISAIYEQLNGGLLPGEFFALMEQSNNRMIPDVLTLQIEPRQKAESGGGLALMTAKPKATRIERTDESVYADKADRIVIHDEDGTLVSVIEIVSPGNKHSKANFRDFTDKAVRYLKGRVSLLVVDLFPPTPRDPAGLHAEIWDRLGQSPNEWPTDRNRGIMSYDAGEVITAYLEPMAIGDNLPEVPLFLGSSRYISLPLQSAYDVSWAAFPRVLKPLLN